MAPLHCRVVRVAPGRPQSVTPQTRRLALLDAFMGYVATFLPHDGHSPHGRPRLVTRTLQHDYIRLRQRLRRGNDALLNAYRLPTSTPAPALTPTTLALRPASRRSFHNYFVTHLPSSSLHPDSSQIAAHKLPRAASLPHPSGASSSASASSSSSLGLGRDLTVVRIPLRSAKHHFGAANARGSRPYNEDTYQAGTIDFPAFAKRAPMSLVRSAISNSRSSGEGINADGAGGDPQIFYFGVFDGHGGTECSEFLRDELHGYIEEAAVEFGLGSTLRHKPRAEEVTAAAVVAESMDPATKAVDLQRELLQQYRNMIGGYFRRFNPASFANGISPPSSLRNKSSSPPTSPSPPAPTPPVTMESVLTYAFLRADLDFVTAQARKPDPDDPYVSDFPLNNDEILGAPHHPPSGLGIGGKARFKGGSTASVALISTPTPAPFWHPAARSTMQIAHVGDTRILLCDTTTGRARPLTRDHHPSSPVEARRLTRFAESLVTDSFGEERISGLANSRAFGDMQSKRIGVTAEPEMERVDLGPAQYAFMVLVSDGVSGTLSDQEIVDVVKEARTPEQASRAVVEYATEVSSDGDNATCLVVRLGGWERRSEGGLGSMGTKELRDARRAEANDPRRGRR